MVRLMRNAEFKGAAAGLLALFAAAAAALCLLSAVQLDSLHRRFVDQSAALAGKLIYAHPEWEREIAGAMLSPATPEQADAGRAALAARGYDAALAADVDPMLKGALPDTLGAALLFMAVLVAAALLLTAHGYAGVYRKVRAVSRAAERVVEGEFGEALPAGGEGEFEVLGHRFNQMANRLRLNVEQLTREKVFLRDTISDISHQLKTPLATLVVYNDLMCEDAGMDEEHRGNFLILCRQQLQRLEWLIQSLLTMARLEAGSIAFRREKATLKGVADAAAAALKTAAQQAGVSMAVRGCSGGAEFTGDPEWLAEAVINILKNGIEHSRPGGTVSITVESTPLTSSVTVADHGEGIDSADLPRIFDRFYRGSAGVKPNSIGIGLAMAKAIVEGQGGSITVRSEKGRGSEFTVTFLKTLE